MNTFIRTSSLVILLFFISCTQEQTEKQSGAAQSLDQWTYYRAYPGNTISTAHLMRAFNENRQRLFTRNNEGALEALGPKNIGGRTLSLAFHPTDPNTIYAGSAGGGLWKSTTQGQGEEAWEPVPTGYPVIAVSSILIHPQNPDIMYIGTGEVYSLFENTGPGVINRFTRGTYGLGILKTTDGGDTWELVLDYSMSELKGIQDMVFNPLNPSTIFAASTDGLLRSFDSGESWQLINPVSMAVDVVVNPVDTNYVYATHGNLNLNFDDQGGLFRSIDGGDSFGKMTEGLPDVYTGKALLGISPSDPDIIYASIQSISNSSNTTPLGLYKTTDKGGSWVKINDNNVAFWQGWYSHDIAVKPDNPNTIIHVGIDVHKSENGGGLLLQQTNWRDWFFGDVPVGGPEGPPNYVHADIHAAYYHPSVPNLVLLATDGGIFVSNDNGNNWEGRNGGFQTTQFYSNFANSTTDPAFAIGGMQDNSTAIYKGTGAWTRTIGGDGMSAAIHPEDDNIVFGTAQNLNLFRSINRGVNFNQIRPFESTPGESSAFNGPYEFAPSNSSVMYAGATRLYKSTDTGLVWAPVNNVQVDEGNKILTIAVSPVSEDVVYIATAPDPFSGTIPPKVMKTENGGQSWEIMQGLPDRVAMDIAFDPSDEDRVYAVFSGYGTDHVYMTENGGESWVSIDNGLPDLPTSTILVDSEFTHALYVGNDIGVYFSEFRGENWSLYSADEPDGLMVMHLSLSPSNRKLRIATHGKGVFQSDMVDLSVSVNEPEGVNIARAPYPNPTTGAVSFEMELNQSERVAVKLYHSNGQLVEVLQPFQWLQGQQNLNFDLSGYPAGSYTMVIEGAGNQVFRKAFNVLLQ